MKGYRPERDKKFSAEEKEMLAKLADAQASSDEDIRELTEEQLKEFKRISDINRANRRKQSVTLRLSPNSLKKARSLGKGYTSVLSRILEAALDDNELLQRYL